MKILEVGCGFRRYDKHFRFQGIEDLVKEPYEYVAVDKKPFDGVDIVADLETGEGIDKMVANGLYDLIICSNVIEHIIDIEKLMGFFHFLLNKGGILFLRFPDTLNELGRYYSFQHPDHKHYMHHDSFDIWDAIHEDHKHVSPADFRIIKKLDPCVNNPNSRWEVWIWMQKL